MDFFDPREPASTWTHGAGFVLAVLGLLLLWRRSGGDPARRLALTIYGLCLAFCYAASTLNHGIDLPADRLAVWGRLDHIGIFLLIAGTYTPLAWGLMRGRWRWGTLASVWAVAAGTSALLALGLRMPIPLATGLYLGMGWGGIICYVELARVVSHRALRPLVIGGLSYSVGAVLNLLGWPVLWPGHFGAHELFHLFVIAGSLAHFHLVLTLVVPSGPGPRGVSHDLGAGVTTSASACPATPAHRHLTQAPEPSR
ncbi:PAQR family membrane homeostasis protein TrhA [Tautonia plasticadhaerens]|uniref:Hemolysin-III related n=1 Tax=Tautonia plasticadhaerens TaxID=2527974 RepID=A0A518H3Y8_9BACT|nr:hemolysin III family protein [Tautonia plasticadhaerens]QDV35538.1 hemolysin-III related [Tautonia plasticadhaerens]